MKFLLLSLSIFLFTVKSHGQNLSGHWIWTDNPEDRTFEITISNPNPIDSTLVSYDLIGNHCGVYYNGGRIDCAEQTSIFLKKEQENTFSGIIISAYSDSIAEITLTYIPEKNQINWQVTEGKGQFYIPHDAFLKKSKPI